MLALFLAGYSALVVGEKGSEEVARALALAMEAKGFAVGDTSPDLRVFVRSAEALDLYYISLTYVLGNRDTAHTQYTVSKTAPAELRSVLDDAASVAMALAEWGRPVGSTTFITDPPGANLYVDGSFQGKTPVTVRGFDPGREYTVKLFKTGYLAWDGKIDMAGVVTDTLRVKLSPVEAPPVAYRERTDFCGNLLMWGTPPGEGDVTSGCLAIAAIIAGVLLLFGCLI